MNEGTWVMLRGFLASIIFLVLAACASSSPKAGGPGVNTESAVTAYPLTVSGTASSANGIATAPDGDPAGADSGLHVIDVPEVAQEATAPPQASVAKADEVVCRREKTTGSHRVTRICRTRAQIDRQREDDQKMIRDMGRKPMPGADRR